MDYKDVDVRAHPIDIHVGQRIKRRRIQIGMSLEALGEAIGGVSFQQVQKYEKGVNRISASRLYLAAQFLGCTPGYFFEELDDTPLKMVGEDEMALFAVHKGAYRIARAYNKRPELRDIFETIAEYADTLPQRRRGAEAAGKV